MGKKRKYETEDEIRRKILKLQDKLAKTTNERERYSSEENLNGKFLKIYLLIFDQYLMRGYRTWVTSFN
jgi:hypothetical protein